MRSGCAARAFLTAGKELRGGGGVPTNGHVTFGGAERSCHAGRRDMPPALRVCIDARITAETSIGVKHFIMGLAHGLSVLDSSTERYLFLTYADAGEWLGSRLSGSCSILRGPISPGREAWKGTLRARFPFLARAWAARGRLFAGSKVRVPESDGLVERSGVDVMHFPGQAAFLTRIASIYHPWDLQHLHFPQFFSRRARAARRVLYSAFCAQARMVCVASAWVKEDVAARLSVPADRVHVVAPGAGLPDPPASGFPVRDVADHLRIPQQYAYYPAETYPHKNHLALLEAVAMLRDRHMLVIPVVFSGRLTPHVSTIRERIAELGLETQVMFLGLVDDQYLPALYERCRCMVFPSLFEGWGMPVMEALSAGVPVACANVTCLPAQVGDAALLFNPSDPEDIAQALGRLWTDEGLRARLAGLGRARSLHFTWERTAQLFRAHYRRIAGRPMTDEDRDLLAAPPLL